MKELYDETCFECSARITKNYSTSFSMGIRIFQKKYRKPIYAIYGFVRFADEIVDTFHDHDKAGLFQKFRADTRHAIDNKISLNPVLHSFQKIYHEYNFDYELVEAFLNSMEMDLNKSNYGSTEYKDYIYGSAEVVGLMCLKVFCKGNDSEYDYLKASARSLGSAFQKINFLRDIKSDYQERGRTYFPELNYENFTAKEKAKIETDIQADFDHGLEGIKNLPKGARHGVYLAYRYYTKLFDQIKKSTPQKVKQERIRDRRHS